MASAAWNGRRGRSSKDWITKNRRRSIYKRDGGACVYCLSRANPLSLDHLIPRGKGGNHESTNLVTACIPCNSKRRLMSLRHFCILIAAETNQDWRAVYARVRNQAKRKTPNDRTEPDSAGEDSRAVP